jgi:hypothetical protein
MAVPQNAEAIIDRLEVQVNGQSSINITNYNTLFHTLLYTTATEDYQRMRKISQSNVGLANEANNGQVLDYDCNDDATSPPARDHVIVIRNSSMH